MKLEYNLVRTDSFQDDFIELTNALDKELAIIDGEDHALYSTFNTINEIKYCVVLYRNNKAIACGGIKPYETHGAEIKRMFVDKNERGKGESKKVLQELEKWAKEIGFTKCVLETGERLPAAISLYKKSGYIRIENYGPYADMEQSICFEKSLN